MATSLLTSAPKDAAAAYATFVFAHGAGAPMDSDFMNVVAEGLAARGIRVVRFEFPYMAKRRVAGASGKSGAPDRTPVSLATFREAVDAVRAAHSELPIFVGGKSMGGRIASMICDDINVAGLVCFGYPFWPPGKTRDDSRIVHLQKMKTRALILQGTRDPFGGRGEVESLRITPSIHFLEDGDHDMKPRKSSGRTHSQNLAATIDAAATFMLRA